MPAEMLPSNCSGGGGAVNASSAGPAQATPNGAKGAASAPRKDRSCKGKRYLEMISESKGSGGAGSGGGGGGGSSCKRPKSNSVSMGSNGESAESSPNKSSTGNSSKWVSGGFDLEERIAALPQLQDTHLVNALNNNRTRNTLNGKGLPATDSCADSRKSAVAGDEHPAAMHAAPVSPSAAAAAGAATPLVNGDTKAANHYVNNSQPQPHNHQQQHHPHSNKHGDKRSSEASASPASSGSTLCSGDEDGDSRSSPALQVVEPKPASDERHSPTTVSPVRGAAMPAAEAVVASGRCDSPTPVREFLASGFSLSRSQGLEVGPCDGLAALAEVALSQAQAITTSSSS